MGKITEDFPDETELDRLKERITRLEEEINHYQVQKASWQKDTNTNHSDLLQRVEEAEARYYGLFEGVPDAILVADAQGNYIDANDSATHLLGYSYDQLLQMQVADVMNLEPAQTEVMFSEFTHKGKWRGEVELRHKDGQVVPAESNATVINLPSGTIYVAVIRDISQRKELEKQKDEFLITASHDLRSPLTSIQGHAQVLERQVRHYLAKEVNPNQDVLSLTKLLEKLLHSTAPIVHQSQRMNELINRLLEFARAQTGQLELKYTPRANLVVLLKQAINQHNIISTQSHNLQLQTEEEDIWLPCDEARIEQVLDNLITNAIKYSPPLSVIEVGIKRDMEKNQAIVWVQDEGYGIGEEEQKRLFERFYRIRSEQTREISGLGLGLYISSEIIKQHAGQMWIKSQAGHGSTFYFSLPLVLSR